MAVVRVDAAYDKETKNKWRFLIEDNDHGISGTVYVNKETMEDKPDEVLKMKVKLPDEE